MSDKKMILVNGAECPAPEAVAPNQWADVYIPRLGFSLYGAATEHYLWDTDNLVLKALLKNGQIYRSHKDCLKRAEAMLLFSPVPEQVEIDYFLNAPDWAICRAWDADKRNYLFNMFPVICVEEGLWSRPKGINCNDFLYNECNDSLPMPCEDWRESLIMRGDK